MTHNEKTNGLVGDLIRKFIFLLALGAFLFSAVNLLCIYQEYKAGADEYTQLEQFTNRWKAKAEEEAPEAPDAEEETYETMENPIDFEGLKEINRDIVGWIEMESVDVFYPIMQAYDNEYYLYRTFRKASNIVGSLFIDYRNNPEFGDRNTVIYGHNMKDGSMFGSLKEYIRQPRAAEETEVTAQPDATEAPGETTGGEEANLDLTAYEISPYFWIYTPEYIYKYEIYSVAEVNEESRSYQLEFRKDEDFQRFIDRTVEQSEIETGVTLGLEDSVVTLSTCTAAYEKRLIVQGKRIETYLAVPPADGYGHEEK